MLLARNGYQVRLWARDSHQASALHADRRNLRYLPEQIFPDTLCVTADLEAAVTAAQLVLIAVPARAFSEVLRAVSVYNIQRMAWATKGFEPGTGRLLHVVAQEYAPASMTAVISGPTFAGEVAQGLPTAITVAASTISFAEEVATYLRSATLRAYTGDDMAGVEVGGAVKNVLAIAAGISDGLGFGANARAALVTRGLAEVMRLGAVLGARRETLMGLAGLGDLVLTCTDDQSRNRRLGLALARGATLEAACADIGQVVEGVETAREVRRLSERHGIEMPIATEVFRVLHEARAPRVAVQALLLREPKIEMSDVR